MTSELTIGLHPKWDEEAGRNVATSTEPLRIVVDPTLDRAGEQRWTADGGHELVLREWDLQVAIHEICHAFLPGGEFNHPLIAQIEVALTPLIHPLAAMDREHREGDHD